MNVLFFAAHADDEVIAAGGTLRKLANAGARIRLVLFSEGAEGYGTVAEADTIVATRERETRAIGNILGIQEYHNEHQLDWNLKVDNATYHIAVRHIREFRPDLVFTHSFADYNDHQAVHKVVVEGWFHAALECAMKDGPVWKHVPLYEYELLQPLAEPSVVVDITDTFDAKVAAMKQYPSQFGVVGSIFQLMEGRALARGYLAGVKYAEAFRRITYRPRKVTDVEKLLD
ncbi:PIG-L family deacetylase [bacterium]|nr:PIG-L family deacetylase [bacterium]